MMFKIAPQRGQKEPVKMELAETRKTPVEGNPYEQLMPSQSKESELCNICLNR
jgi:hypothetical protein